MITKYEIIATKNERRYTVGYTGRKTKSSLAFNAKTYAHMIVNAINADPEAVCVKHDTNEVVMSDGTRIFFSGRTELDAARAA